MARIRSIKPELRTSLTVAEWPREVRYAWVLLWGYLDDHGRGHDDTRLIVADLFPLDRDVTKNRMARWLNLLADGADPVVCRYQTEGRNYLHAIKWQDHQRVDRPSTARIPPCPLHEPDASRSWKETRGTREGLDGTSREAREDVANDSTSRAGARPRSREQGAGSREQGNKGAGSGGPVPNGTPDRARPGKHTPWTNPADQSEYDEAL